MSPDQFSELRAELEAAIRENTGIIYDALKPEIDAAYRIGNPATQAARLDDIKRRYREAADRANDSLLRWLAKLPAPPIIIMSGMEDGAQVIAIEYGDQADDYRRQLEQEDQP